MSTQTSQRAHPHSRGENCRGGTRTGRRGGSSPLTRGKLLPLGDVRFAYGLIPTHAGKTHTASQRRSLPAAHPHSRGENSVSVPSHEPVGGSSPLTRGKRSAFRCAQGQRRLIPTHAGKTRRTKVCLESARAHPHSRGENEIGCGVEFAACGSSPLTRGKPPRTIRLYTCHRLIPTHAGKTTALK